MNWYAGFIILITVAEYAEGSPAFNVSGMRKSACCDCCFEETTTEPALVTCPECPDYPTVTTCPPTTCTECTCPTWYPTTCPDCPVVTCATYPSPSTWVPSTCPPPVDTSSPTFSKTFYTSSVPSWPSAGTRIHPGVSASTVNQDLILYKLIDPPTFVELVTNEDILFTTEVSEGAYVGPNNVMTLEVQATVYGDATRSSRSVILVVFPSRISNDAELM